MPLHELLPFDTPRLVIRELAEADLPHLLEVNGDDAVTRHLPYDTWRSPADAQAWRKRVRAQTAGGQGRQLVVVHREQACAIGTVLLFRLDEGSRRIELGYVLGRPWWRQGLMREALQATIGQVFGPLGLRRIEAEVQPDNVGSNALLKQLGFVHEGRSRERWQAKGRVYDVERWGLLAREWVAPPATGPGRGPE